MSDALDLPDHEPDLHDAREVARRDAAADTGAINESALLSDLTDVQREAVTHTEGPILVLAGPGSGKTRVITRRVAFLIANGIPAWQILAVTFTNKAAGEMRDRIDALVPANVPGRAGLTVSTFHTLCARLLRRHAEEAGIDPAFVIYDAQDQRAAITTAIERAELARSNWPPASVAHAISAAKNELQDAQDFSRRATDFRTRQLARIFVAYEELLAAANALDFDDLLLRTARLMERGGPAAVAVRERFRYLLIDEYQDTNRAQFVIARAIASGSGNICVVGDPDQSIYGWRGADLRNILDFEAHFQRAHIVPLGENFRSTGHIVDASAALITHNRHRRDKRLFTARDDGERVRVIATDTERHEAQVVLETIQEAIEEGIPLREMAILYRMNAYSRVLEEVLRDASVPYLIVRGTAFYDRREVRDALAYLRLILNPNDLVSLERVANVPTRGLGAASLARVREYAGNHRIPLIDALAHADAIDGVSPKARAAAAGLTSMLGRWRRQASETVADPERLAALVDAVLIESGLLRHHGKRTDDETDGEDRVANLLELVNAARQLDTSRESVRPIETLLDQLAAWLESVSLVADSDAIDPGRGAVTLMTLHAAKGLEYDLVAMVAIEQGSLPHARSVGTDHGLEEERRLCFVGMTRARRRLLLTYAASRTVRGYPERTIPSQFLSELPNDAVEMLDRTDPMGDSGRDPWATPQWGTRHTGGGQSRRRDERGVGSLGGLEPGCLVRHQHFGVGRVEALMPRGPSSSVRVRFADGGVKTLVLGIAPLERIDEIA